MFIGYVTDLDGQTVKLQNRLVSRLKASYLKECGEI
jgi:hypothetical protein